MKTQDQESKNKNMKGKGFVKNKEETLANLGLSNIVFGKISERTKGGFWVEFGPYKGLLFFSQISIFPELLNPMDINKLIGTYSEFEIKRVSVEPFLIILSKKSLQLNPKFENVKKEILISEIKKTILNLTSDQNITEKLVASILNEVEDKFFTFMDNYEDESEFTTWVYDNMFQEPEQKVRLHNYYNDDSFCQACESAPCRCSDPEKTSTTWIG